MSSKTKRPAPPTLAELGFTTDHLWDYVPFVAQQRRQLRHYLAIGHPPITDPATLYHYEQRIRRHLSGTAMLQHRDNVALLRITYRRPLLFWQAPEIDHIADLPEDRDAYPIITLLERHKRGKRREAQIVDRYIMESDYPNRSRAISYPGDIYTTDPDRGSYLTTQAAAAIAVWATRHWYTPVEIETVAHDTAGCTDFPHCSICADF